MNNRLYTLKLIFASLILIEFVLVVFIG